MTREQLIEDLEWILEENEQMKARGRVPPPVPAEELGHNRDPAWTAVRRLLTGQILGISERYVRAILEHLKSPV